MAATTPTVLTVSGTPTNFLPLVTPYSAPTSCSNYIYKQEGPTYLAFDPYYGLNIDTDAATCLPSQVSTWWSQASDAVTTTVLGNSFNCPSLYRTVASSTASGFEHIYCCPSYVKRTHQPFPLVACETDLAGAIGVTTRTFYGPKLPATSRSSVRRRPRRAGGSRT